VRWRVERGRNGGRSKGERAFFNQLTPKIYTLAFRGRAGLILTVSLF
jgi:hypothetical protein